MYMYLFFNLLSSPSLFFLQLLQRRTYIVLTYLYVRDGSEHATRCSPPALHRCTMRPCTIFMCMFLYALSLLTTLTHPLSLPRDSYWLNSHTHSIVTCSTRYKYYVHMYIVHVRTCERASVCVYVRACVIAYIMRVLCVCVCACVCVFAYNTHPINKPLKVRL